MKILHIAERMKSRCGGSVCIARNLEMLQRYFGKENVSDFELYRRKSGMLRAFWTDVTNLSFYGIDHDIKDNIEECIKKNNIQLIFLDTSNIGILAKFIRTKFPQIKIVTFFHNVEFIFWRKQLLITKKIIFFHKMVLAYINEICSFKYSNATMALNERDAKMINKYYHKKVDTLIPISLEGYIMKPNMNLRGKYMLFLGSNFPPNISGISFFIEKVLPYVSYKLIVAGSGMEVLKAKYNISEQLQIQGFVDDLNSIYRDAMFVVLPIFSGSGMKVKTAEALKYGKYIIAAPEALEGYDYNENVAKCCVDAKAFITEINRYDVNRVAYNVSSRVLFEEKYSTDAVFCKFSKFLNNLLSKKSTLC